VRFTELFITAHDGDPMGREERCVERLSVLLISCGCGKDKDRAAEKRL
jgi:hypothetical protein